MTDDAAHVVGEAGSMPGTTGFTMAAFKASEVPVGTKLYIRPPAMLADAERETTSTTAASIIELMEGLRSRAPFGYHEPGSSRASHRNLILHGADIERLLDKLLDAAIAVERAERGLKP